MRRGARGQSEASDERLLVSVGDGDEHAFEELWRRWSGWGRAIAVRILGSAEHASDTLQEVAMEVVRSACRFRGEESGRARAWFLVLLTRTCRRRRSRDARWRPADLTLTEPGCEPVDRAAVLTIRQLVLALPERQQSCVLLRYASGMTDSEIAAELGISVGSVKTHISRARKTLRRALETVRDDGTD